MGERKEEKKSAPPYLSYKTFVNFLDKLTVAMPSRIDSSVMNTYSGGVQVQLLATLRYLILINSGGIPTEEFTKLVASDGDERKKILKEIIVVSYPFLFKDGISLNKITLKHLQELFENEGASGGTVRKCVAFFIAASKNAGIELSPHVTVKGASSRNISTKGRKVDSERSVKLKNDMVSDDKTDQAQMGTQTLEQILLSKFPGFDPAWPDEVKAKWFEGFKELMEHFKKE